MNPVVIYSSQSGFTQTYALWIAQELGCKILPLKQAASEDLSAYDIIIYGGPVNASTIVGWKPFRKRLASLPSAQPVLFATGLAPASDQGNLENLQKINLGAADTGRVPFFYFRGGVNMDRMNIITRWIMKMIINGMQKTVSPEELAKNPDPYHADYTAREAIAPLVDWVKVRA